MRTVFVVPHRGLAAAKTRLAPALSESGRADLAARLLERVLDTLAALDEGAEVLLISPDDALRPIAESRGARLLVQRGLGLNEGLEQARAAVIEGGGGILAVLHGDLPQLLADDVRALLAPLLAAPGVAVAPDQTWSGTNGLAMRPPDAIGFRFGPGSFEAHLHAARGAGLPVTTVERPGLAFDLDTPADLERLLAAEAP